MCQFLVVLFRIKDDVLLSSVLGTEREDCMMLYHHCHHD